MKEALDVNRLRRIGLPGIILALGFHPFIAAWVTAYGKRAYDFSPSTVFLAEVFFFGLIASSATPYIYYVYEGFRLPVLTRLARTRNKRKLRATIIELQRLYNGRTREDLRPDELEKATKLGEFLADFPLLETRGQLYYRVERPTRLGNIIAAYELYGQTRHKLDVRTYWHHLLSCAPETARKDFEDAVSFSESLVLASAAGLAVSIVALATFIGLLTGTWQEAFVIGTVPLSRTEAIYVFVGGLLCWWLFYRLATASHREVGGIFRALIDLSVETFFDRLGKLHVPPDNRRTERAAAVAEYLTYGTPLPALDGAARGESSSTSPPPDTVQDLGEQPDTVLVPAVRQ